MGTFGVLVQLADRAAPRAAPPLLLLLLLFAIPPLVADARGVAPLEKDWRTSAARRRATHSAIGTARGRGEGGARVRPRGRAPPPHRDLRREIRDAIAVPRSRAVVDQSVGCSSSRSATSAPCSSWCAARCAASDAGRRRPRRRPCEPDEPLVFDTVAPIAARCSAAPRRCRPADTGFESSSTACIPLPTPACPLPSASTDGIRIESVTSATRAPTPDVLDGRRPRSARGRHRRVRRRERRRQDDPRQASLPLLRADRGTRSPSTASTWPSSTRTPGASASPPGSRTSSASSCSPARASASATCRTSTTRTRSSARGRAGGGAATSSTAAGRARHGSSAGASRTASSSRAGNGRNWRSRGR